MTNASPQNARPPTAADADATITVQHIPSVRFWDIPLPAVVVTRCHGEPLLLAAWVTLATMQRTDAALGCVGRPASALATALGLATPGHVAPLLDELVARGLLTAHHETLGIPWGNLQRDSLAAAGATMDAAGLRTAPPAEPPAQQCPLPGLD